MKIFASDYDGTIKIDGSISERNLTAIKNWTKRGNVFGLVTGRSVESALQEIKKYELPVSFLVCNNGGVIYDKEMNLLKLYEMDLAKAKQLIADIRSMRCNSFVLNNGFYRAKEIVDSAEEDYKYGTYSSDYSVERILDEGRIGQIVISVNDNEYGKEQAACINEKYVGYMNAFPNVNCIDIVPDNVDKAQGLRFVQDYFGYAKEDIYCMGDSYNDLPMLLTFHSATLTHTFEDVKAQIDIKVKDVCEYLTMLENE